MGLLRAAPFLLLTLAFAVPSAAANAVVGHSVGSDETGTQANVWTADNQQRAYVRVDNEGWVGAGTHDAAAIGVGAHAGTDTTVGYGLGARWCDAGVKADEPDLVHSRGTDCLGYECLDERGYEAILAFALASPMDYLAYVSASGRPC